MMILKLSQTGNEEEEIDAKKLSLFKKSLIISDGLLVIAYYGD